MKIVYIITRSDTVGGAHVHIRDLSRMLGARGHDVCVLVGGEGPFTEDLRAHAVPYRSLKHLVRPIRPGEDIRAVLELRAALRELQPNLISTHSSKAGLVGRLAGRSLGIPTIFTAHGWAFTEGVPQRERVLYRWIEKAAAPFASQIITVSEHDRQLALDFKVALPDKVITVHNGMPDVDSVLRANPAEGRPRLVMVARFEPQKDHATLFRAMAAIRDLDFDVDLVGDGPLRSQAEQAVKELGLASRVRFLGRRRDVADILAQAHVFLLVSNWEGFPRSILEAMRAGLPVIASDVGGVRESVRDGETGYVVARGDANLLRDRLKQLVSDSALRDRQGRAARERYEAKFTFEHMLDQTWAVYEDVISKH